MTINNNILLFIILFIFSNDIIYFSTLDNSLLINSKYLIYAFSFVFFLSGNINNIKLSGLIFFVFCVLFSSILNFDFRFGYISHLLILLSTFFLVEKFDINKFCLYFSKILYFLSICALCVYGFSFLYGSLLFFSLENSVGTIFYGLPIALMIDSDAGVRITSIFREPGVFAFYLCFALLSNIFVLNNGYKIFNLRSLVFLLCIFLTKSTAGYMVLLLCIIYFIINNLFNLNSKRNILMVILFSFFFILLFFILFDNIEGKFLETGGAFWSFQSRMAGFSIPLEIIKDNFFGVGVSGFEKYFDSISHEEYAGKFSSAADANSTFLNLIAVYGVVISYFIFSSIRNSFYHFKYAFIIISFLILFSFSLELRFSFLFNYLIIYFYIRKLKKVAK